VTRQDLADLAGTTLYTASRVVSSWDHQGLILAGRKQITIADLDKFAQTVLERG
jgi:CRP-like cAMP-binding protein